jgi:D-alanine-D-alanine ligase
MKKLKVGVIYGGRSSEHEVSIASAAAVFKHLKRSRYEPVPIRIEKDGRWTLADRPPTALAASEVIDQARLSSAHAVRPGREAHLVSYPAEETLLTIDRPGKGDDDSARVTGLGLDVVFPVLHGPYGEDGTVQGLLELANVPYVGAGVLASAVGMDKAFMKVAFLAAGLPVAPYRVLLAHQWREDSAAQAAAIAQSLGFPLFVKPANLGSSVGISKAKTGDELVTAIELALQFDRKVVVEAAVAAAREIEVGVLGNDHPEASVAGEIIPSREFYDYEAKYLDEGSVPVIPADLDEATAAEVRRLAIQAFQAVDGSGLARVDFLLARETGRIYVNEVNTLPGFTTISMYSKLWAASGIEYPELLDRLIALALERHAAKQGLRTSAV